MYYLYRYGRTMPSPPLHTLLCRQLYLGSIDVQEEPTLQFRIIVSMIGERYQIV
eukprot:SAG31_NODE_39832_length_285_cov_0.827957_1_plen_53_part_01